MTVLGGIDAGGTTFKCGLRDGDGRWLAKHRVRATDPAATLAGCVEFFRSETESLGIELAGLGIASFGPIDIDPASPRYGTILDTPKPGWSGTDLRGAFRGALGVEVAVDTDVNGALLAEMRSGAAAGASSAAYITVGTGVGAGLASGGRVLARPLHPEFGHIPIRRHPTDTEFEGVCPFHGDCLEGLASVTALKARWGDPLDWGSDHPGWDLAAHYLAQACLALTYTLRLERIVLGGGLMLSPHLLPKIRRDYAKAGGGYLGDTVEATHALIVTPGHGDDAGLVGAVELGRQRAG